MATPINNNMAAIKRYVVVGGGIAGVSCAEQLSQMDPTAHITLVSASKLIKSVTNFQKVTRTLELFDVEETDVSHLTRSCSNVTVINSHMTSVNPDQHIIHLHNSQALSYHKLCLCLGARPKLITRDHPNDVIGIRDTESVGTLQHKLSSARRVVIVGNGGIATELVYELSGCTVLWVVKDSSISSTFFDEGAASFFLPSLRTQGEASGTGGSGAAPDETVKTKPLKRMRYLLDPVDQSASGEGKDDTSGTAMGSALGPDWSSGIKMIGNNKEKGRNVHVEYNCEVERLLDSQEMKSLSLTETLLSGTENESIDSDKTSWPFYVKLTNGKVYGADFIVSATGVIPNTDRLLDTIDISKDDLGLVVDEEMRTSAVDVYAAGDVCTTSWPSVPNTWFQMRLWSQARQMGAYAAKCMLAHSGGESITLDFCFELFAHVTTFFGYKVVLLGCYNAQGLGKDYELLLRITNGVEYVKVILQHGRMVGAILIGDTDLEETFENLILNRMDLTRYGENLLDPSIDIEDYFD
ncbi:PREDICTED: pyridine nucleotide-disulfide oxidoreductase domain-containing protein 1-like [Amphimedon queenslandica]|uniref:Pyridine nucleotide-disulfide oxidoreductase domain-containing protein 1 n=2 Tax=Amphimedon queenslandica TaxID=400682 RepID=A0AAN0IC98_AMPQE|nr:PREDICTED: pyridine nucleotide-disulfide oxidoreductase domain-containing protein 1-like [Amphimedon queenslandica]|eukprot:XP_003385104.2 PREDICTED: pyridine nucleotide-disulfide oxidoreductase domain-containing protein 1-like [Amphimedon queenslandica]